MSASPFSKFYSPGTLIFGTLFIFGSLFIIDCFNSDVLIRIFGYYHMEVWTVLNKCENYVKEKICDLDVFD